MKRGLLPHCMLRWVSLLAQELPVDRRTDSLQGTLTETLGIALAVLRQLDDALSQCTSDRVVAARSDPERGQRHLKGNTHLTDRFAVKLVTVEVRSDGHASRAPTVLAPTRSWASGISASAVRRIWKEAHGLQPHRYRQFKLSNDPNFVDKLRDVVRLYVDPPAHAIVLSLDEKSHPGSRSTTGIDKDRPDYTVFGGWAIGRIYQTRGGPEHLRWFWAMTVTGLMTRSERVATLEEAKAQLRKSWTPGGPGRRVLHLRTAGPVAGPQR